MFHRTCLLLVATLLLASTPSLPKKKDKPAFPEIILKAQKVLVLIQPDAAEPLNDPLANRKAQEAVEKALMRWGRFSFALDVNTADLVIAVRKGTGKAANPTISGGPIDTRPGTIETTDSQIRIGGSAGRPPDGTQTGDPTSSNSRVHTGVEAGAAEDSFVVYQGGVPFSVGDHILWKHIERDGLHTPDLPAVEQFRKAIEEAEKAAAQKKQQPAPAVHSPPSAAKTP